MNAPNAISHSWCVASSGRGKTHQSWSFADSNSSNQCTSALDAPAICHWSSYHLQPIAQTYPMRQAFHLLYKGANNTNTLSMHAHAKIVNDETAKLLGHKIVKRFEHQQFCWHWFSLLTHVVQATNRAAQTENRAADTFNVWLSQNLARYNLLTFISKAPMNWKEEVAVNIQCSVAV